MEKIFDIRHIFEPVLVIAFLISAFCYLVYFLWFRKALRKDIGYIKSKFIKRERKEAIFAAEQSHVNNPFKKFVYFWADLFGVLFIVVFLRSFIFEPFVIPSASMYPGLVEGDIVIVNKHAFGIRLPVLGTKVTEGAPEAGDVTVFKYPKDETTQYIKRTIGVAGDKVQYDNRTLFLNGTRVPLGSKPSQNGVNVYEETFNDKPHLIQYDERVGAKFFNDVVPKNHYFVMGDNRDHSHDSRFWGYVKDDKIIGKATYIAFNWHCLFGDGKCDRFLKRIK